MSVWGDLFYQLWSYSETPPTATPTSSHDDTWLQEALQQEQVFLILCIHLESIMHNGAIPGTYRGFIEHATIYLFADLQELQVGREEWHDAKPPVNFNSLLDCEFNPFFTHELSPLPRLNMYDCKARQCWCKQVY